MGSHDRHCAKTPIYLQIQDHTGSARVRVRVDDSKKWRQSSSFGHLISMVFEHSIDVVDVVEEQSLVGHAVLLRFLKRERERVCDWNKFCGNP